MHPSCTSSTDYSKSVVYFVGSKKTDTSTSPYQLFVCDNKSATHFSTILAWNMQVNIGKTFCIEYQFLNCIYSSIYVDCGGSQKTAFVDLAILVTKHKTAVYLLCT